jgi:TRAP-type C4-dicarboxylate transport system permease small subunit
MALLISSEVASRAFIGSSTGISWEFSTYLMATLFFFGAAHTVRTEGHVRVSLLLQALPPRAARLLDLTVTLLALAVCVFLTAALFDLALTSLARNHRSLTPIRTPLAIPQLFVAFGALCVSLALASRFLKLWLFPAAFQEALANRPTES